MKETKEYWFFAIFHKPQCLKVSNMQVSLVGNMDPKRAPLNHEFEEKATNTPQYSLFVRIRVDVLSILTASM